MTNLAERFDPVWLHFVRMTGIILLCVLVALILIIIAAVLIARAVDRDGVDDGKELPKVDRALAIQQAKTTTVGYDARRKKNISTFMGLARYERTLGKKCGVGLQTYVHLQHHLGILFLFMIPFFLPQMVYHSMGDGHRLDFPLAGLTLANVEPGLGNAKKMEESWFMEIGPARMMLVSSWGELEPHNLSLSLAALDAAFALVLFLFIAYELFSSIPAIEAEHDEMSDTMSDFSLRVDRLPHQLPEGNDQYSAQLQKEIIQRIETTRKAEQAFGKSGPDQGSDAPVEVLEVTIAREGFGKAEAILTEMESIEWWLEVEVDKHRSGHVKKLEEKFTAKSTELKELPDPRTANAVRAFVVLGRSADVPRALGKVDGGPFAGAVIGVAPEPEDVVWAYQEASFRKRVMRRIAVFLVNFLLLAGALMLVVFLLKHKLSATNDSECIDPHTQEPEAYKISDVLSHNVTMNHGEISPYKTQHCMCLSQGIKTIVQNTALWHPCNSYMFHVMSSKIFLVLFLLSIVITAVVYEVILDKCELIRCPLTYTEIQLSCFVSYLLIIMTVSAVGVLVVISKFYGGPYEWMSHQWYIQASDALTLGSVAFVGGQVFVRIMFGLILPFLIQLLVGCFTHQKVANEVASFKQPYEPAKRMAEMCCTLCMTIIFATVIPPLALVAPILIALFAFFDRVFLLRGAKPDDLSVDAGVTKLFLWVLLVALVLHALGSVYLFGHPLLFPGWMAYGPQPTVEEFDAHLNMTKAVVIHEWTPQMYEEGTSLERLSWHLRSVNALPAQGVLAFFFLFIFVVIVIRIVQSFSDGAAAAAEAAEDAADGAKAPEESAEAPKDGEKAPDAEGAEAPKDGAEAPKDGSAAAEAEAPAKKKKGRTSLFEKKVRDKPEKFNASALTKHGKLATYVPAKPKHILEYLQGELTGPEAKVLKPAENLGEKAPKEEPPKEDEDDANDASFQ